MKCSYMKKVAKPELYIKNLCWVVWQVTKMSWNLITCCRDGLLPGNGMWGRNLGPDVCYYQLLFISSVHICSVCVCVYTYTHTRIIKILWMFEIRFHNTHIKELCTMSWSVIWIHIVQYFFVTEVINYFIVERTLRSLLNGWFCPEVNEMRRNIFTRTWQQGERFLIFIS